MNLFYNPKYVGDVAFYKLNQLEGELNYNKKVTLLKLLMKVML